MSLVFASCVLALASAQASQSPFETQLKTLRDLVASLKIDQGQKNVYTSNLDASEGAVKRGDPALALYYIRNAMPNLLAYSAIETETELKDLSDLESYWKAQEPSYEANQAMLSKSGYKQLPMATKALIEEAVTQAETLHKTGILFGKESGLQSGIFYIRQTIAFLEFANLAASQTGPGVIKQSVLAGMFGAQDKLRGDIIDAYIQHGGGDEPAKPLIVTAHSRMKVADDLIEEGRLSGAAMVVVQGKFELALALAMIGKVQVDPTPLSALLDKRREEAKSLPDPSIAMVFINLAEDKLKAGQEPDLIRAKVLIEDVIPFAFEVLK